jgi:hypothetical protein
MKKLMINTKKTFIFYMSILAVIGLLWSCEEQETEFTWDENAAPTLMSISPTSAKVGNEITIAGKYFSSTANNKISFNGLEATITAANISVIKAILPEGATSGDVIVTSNGKASNGIAITVVQPIIPTIASIDPIKGKVGETETITGTDFSSTRAVIVERFNGTFATVTESTATTITTTVPAGASTGDVTVARDGESNGIEFTVSISYSFSVQITESWDDVEEGALNGAMANESSDLELGEYDTWTQDGVEQGVQTIGLRFPGIDIPSSAIILSANIQFTCDKEGADEAEMTISGENVGDAASFTEDFYNVTSRTKTSENVVWSIPEWVNEGDAGAAEKTADLVNIVQEIINRGDWTSGNSMAFILAPSGVSSGVTSSSAGREAESVDGSSSGTLAPVLTIIYE